MKKVKINKGTNTVISKDGKVFMEAEKKVKRWKQYLEELYNGNLDERVLEKEDSVEKHDKGEHILQSEFDAAVEYITDNKASGIDELPIQLIENGGQVPKSK